jgi:hypothetical protein
MVAARLTRFDPKRNWRRSESSPIRSLIRASKLVAPAPLGTMTLTEMGYARSNTRSVCFGSKTKSERGLCLEFSMLQKSVNGSKFNFKRPPCLRMPVEHLRDKK